MSIGPAVVLDPDKANDLARSQDAADRRSVAGSLQATPELLLHLAGDRDCAVRLLVAENVAAPAQADLALADDAEEAVRVALARKLGRWAGGLAADDPEASRRTTFQVLDRLVHDRSAAVRRALAETVRTLSGVASSIIATLACDRDPSVCAPIIEGSPLLGEGALIEIARRSPAPGAARIVARRHRLPEAVTAALAAQGDAAAVEIMLDNPGAEIAAGTMEQLIDRSAAQPAWQRRLADRPDLGDAGALRLARLAPVDLIDHLRMREDLAIKTLAALHQIRLDRADRDLAEDDAAAAEGPDRDLIIQARRLARAGHLNEDTLVSAMKSRQTGLVRAGLAVLADLPIETVDAMLSREHPRAIVALAWRAGLPMGFAHRLQTSLVRVPIALVIKPRPNGSYPLSDELLGLEVEAFVGAEE